MQTIIRNIKRFCYTKIFVLFNLSAVAFTFQACYGVPQDDFMDVTITGYVADSESREPIPGIEVNAIKIGTTSYTDEDGFFFVRAQPNSIYTLVFRDTDGADNGEYWEKTTNLTDSTGSGELSLKVMLNPKVN